MISLGAIAGIRTQDTMQIYVTIRNEHFIALLDSGSTHNFVCGDVAHRVGLQFAPCLGAGVIVANGDRVACRGLARDVGIRIADEFFSVDCYSIPLDKWDMVLGVSFLLTLGRFSGISTTSAWPSHVATDVCSGGALALPAMMSSQRAASMLYTTSHSCWTPCCTLLRMCLLNRRGCPWHGTVTTTSIYCLTRRRWQFALIDTLSSRKMSWKSSVPLCCSRASSDQARQRFRRRYF
jgi:hypothetical protein